jgi:hypothetical protein
MHLPIGVAVHDHQLAAGIPDHTVVVLLDHLPQLLASRSSRGNRCLRGRASRRGACCRRGREATVGLRAATFVAPITLGVYLQVCNLGKPAPKARATACSPPVAPGRRVASSLAARPALNSAILASSASRDSRTIAARRP